MITRDIEQLSEILKTQFHFLIIDCSDYEQSVDWDKLPKTITDVIIKAGGSGIQAKRVISHAQGAARTGRRVHLYYWDDPIEDAVNQAKHYLSIVDSIHALKIRVWSISVDVEQWWADWDKWAKYKNTAQANLIPVLSPQKISDHGLQVVEYLEAHTSIKVIVYTANWFITSYCKPMLAWLPKKYLWLAEYVGDRTAVTTTWERLAELQPAVNQVPTLPAGCTLDMLIFWQWTGDKYKVPGVWSIPLVRLIAVDVNAYRGKLPLGQFFGWEEAEAPQTEDEVSQPASIEPYVVIDGSRLKALNIPYIPQIGPGADQHQNDCGAACGAMIVSGYKDAMITPDEFYYKTGVTSDQFLSFGAVKYVLANYGITAEYQAGLTPGALYEILASKRPVICLILYSELVKAGLTTSKFQGFHFVVAVGITIDGIIIHDPLHDGQQWRFMIIPFEVFFSAWKAAGDDPTKNPANAALYPVTAIGEKATETLRMVQITTADGVKIRSTPETKKDNSNQIGTISYRTNGKITQVWVSSIENGWAKLAGQAGYISMSCAKVV
jgi:GH25 family lysozyme M1 (1,4-beta-N-acetylmuramidase)